MANTFVRWISGAALAAGVLMGHGAVTAPGASAAQPWTCICDGKPKRHLASTRHCEHKMSLPKGQWCTTAQFRKVYGPACRKEGCSLPPPLKN
ncbi:MAG: hypothetical protein ABL898_16345 [Hyphomicrobiaceae bacterium]